MMKIIYVDESADEAPHIEGHRVAAVSNAGCPAGKLRVTYLPESAFVKETTDIGEIGKLNDPGNLGISMSDAPQ